MQFGQSLSLVSLISIKLAHENVSKKPGSGNIGVDSGIAQIIPLTPFEVEHVCAI